ncbi:restriction endonuclease subunit S, partial [Schinkia azotoformans]
DKSKFVCYSNFKSQFIEMFGLPIDNVKCFKKGTIREVVSEVKYGTSKPATIGGKYPYLRMNNITYEGQLDLTDLKFIDIPDKEIEKCVVRKGDVLFNRTNSKELVGKTCVFNIDTPMVIAGYIIRVKVNEKVIPEYLSTFLNLKYSKNILFEMCKAAIGQANINAQELQDIEIIIPPMSLQLKFLDLLHQTDKSKLSEHVTYNSLGDMLVNLNLFRR